MKEHRDACQKGTLEKSALAEHAWTNYHQIKWEEVSVMDQDCQGAASKGGCPHPAESPIPQQGCRFGAAWMLDGSIEGHKKRTQPKTCGAK